MKYKKFDGALMSNPGALRARDQMVRRQTTSESRAPKDSIMRVVRLAFVAACSFALVACGGGKSDPPAQSLSGNWVITLNRVANPAPITYSGFLLENGQSISGSWLHTSGCPNPPSAIPICGCPSPSAPFGADPVTGSMSGQNVALTVNESVDYLSLTGTLQSSGSVGGQFSGLGGGCSAQTTGNWTAVQIPPVSGSFHGAINFSITPTPPSINVTGTMTQGTNIGSSNATLSGVIALASNQGTPFCAPAFPLTMTGVISGTTASFLFYDANGNPIGGNQPPSPGTVTPNANSLTTSIPNFPVFFSGSCSSTESGSNGASLQVTFP